MPDTTFIYALCEPGTRTIRYIGKSNDPDTRLRGHLSFSSKQKNHLGCWLAKLISEDSKPNMLILKEVLRDEWEQWEKSYIRNAKMLGFDLTNSVEGGNGHEITQEIREKISRSNKGKIRTQEHRELISRIQTGRKLSEEWCANVSRALKGKKRSIEAKENYSRCKLGTKRTSGSSKFLGVCIAPGKRWKVGITVGGHLFYLGYYASEIDAALAYDWVAALYGQKLNFPEKGSH